MAFPARQCSGTIEGRGKQKEPLRFRRETSQARECPCEDPIGRVRQGEAGAHLQRRGAGHEKHA